MAPTGFHGLMGIFLSKFVRSPALKTGLVFGSVIPDIDLFGSVLIYVLTSNEELTITFHRTLTHSFFTISFIVLAGILLEYTGSDLTFDGGKLKLALLLIGTGSGMFIHVLMDFLYLDGVSALAPLSWDRIHVIDLSFDDFTIASQKKLAAADFQFEALFWLVLWYLAGKKTTDDSLKIKLLGRDLEITDLRNKVAWLSVTEALLMFGFLLFAFTPVGRNDFIIYMYIPGVLALFLTFTLPLIFRESLYELPENPTIPF
ncbi:MAG: metal-dependent hydrolase [Candidatus Odinarchaeota archaeon]